MKLNTGLCHSLATLAILPLFVAGAVTPSNAPSATVKNGTYVGKYDAEWDQDHFLGIPFAVPPVGPLRFARPKSIDTAFTGTRNATTYGYSCYQYSNPTFNLSEDCLTLNVIRPAGTKAKAKLPVLVWVYGGGLFAGSSADPQYNVSGIARVGQDIKKPVIVVSINYRLGVWGFLNSPQILAEGNTNAGLLDQRLAFRWIKENIAAFGGDPNKITLWGESAGAQSIAYHLLSYDGRDDRLFHGAILESGGPTGAQVQALPYYAAHVENLTRSLNCWTATDQLACLREVPAEELWKKRVATIWNPLIDGDFLTAYPSDLMKEKKFIRIPMLNGANSDEGSSFGATGIDNETALFNSLMFFRNYAISAPNARKLLKLYPNDPANQPPFYIKEPTLFPSKGLQWRRSAAINGDLVMISGRRKFCELYTEAGQDVYSYRFDTPLWNAAVTDGVRHFVNVVFSFQNISGALGPLPQYQSYADLSASIGRAYISFVNDFNPNSSRGKASTLPEWPKYDNRKPKNMVLNSNKTYIEDDTWRKKEIDFINTIAREILA